MSITLPWFSGTPEGYFMSQEQDRLVFGEPRLPNSPVWKAIEPALRTLSLVKGRKSYCYSLIKNIPNDGWKDEDLIGLRGWSDKDGNQVLLVFSALCRVGMLHFTDGRWQLTEFGKSQTSVIRNSLWVSPTLHNLLARAWNKYPEIEDDYLETLRLLTWEPLKEVHKKNEGFLEGLVRRPFYHQDIPVTAGVSREGALEVVSAMAMVGALQNLGFRWRPSLYGAWLAVSPDSILNK